MTFKKQLLTFSKELAIGLGAFLAAGSLLSSYIFWKLSPPPQNSKPVPIAAKTYPVPPLAWQFKADGRIYTTPALAQDGTLYVTSDDVLYALNFEGTKKWHFYPGVSMRGNSPIVDQEGSIYIVTGRCEIYKLNPDGSQLWVRKVGETEPGKWLQEAFPVESSCYSVNTSALSPNGEIIVPSQSGTVWVVDSRTGDTSKRLSSAFAQGRSSPAVLSDGTILQGTDMNDGTLSALNDNNEILWTVHNSTFASVGSPAVARDTSIVISDADRLLSLSSTGDKQWELPGAWGWVPVITANGTILDSLNYREFAAVGRDGKILWKLPIASASPAAVAANGDIYLMGAEGNLQYAYAVSANGSIEWRLPVNGLSEGSPTIANDGTVYFATSGLGSEVAGMIYAVRQHNGGLMKSGWPKFHRDQSNNGLASEYEKNP